MVMQDNSKRTVGAKVAPSKRVVGYALEVAKRTTERLVCRKVILRIDSEPAILALKAVRRESDAEVVLGRCQLEIIEQAGERRMR